MRKTAVAAVTARIAGRAETCLQRVGAGDMGHEGLQFSSSISVNVFGLQFVDPSD